MGNPHALFGCRGVPPGRLPPGHRLAARQQPDRVRVPSLRPRRAGGAPVRRAARGLAALPARPAPRVLRRVRPRPLRGAGPVPGGVPSAGVGRRCAAGPPGHDARPRGGRLRSPAGRPRATAARGHRMGRAPGPPRRRGFRRPAVRPSRVRRCRRRRRVDQGRRDRRRVVGGRGCGDGRGVNRTTPRTGLLIALALTGVAISTYLALFELGAVRHVWDPLFADGSERVLRSAPARALPVPDALLGVFGYALEVVLLIGVLASGPPARGRLTILLGAVATVALVASIGLVVLQAVVVGAW